MNTARSDGLQVLIIGGTRFLGRLLVLELLRRGHAVTVLNRGRTAHDLPDAVRRVRADRTVPGALAASVGERRFDAVVDMAAYRGADARGAVDAFAGRTSHYVHVSSGQVYLVRTPPVPEPAVEASYPGNVIDAPPAGTRDHDEWLYGVGKRECEDVLSEARQRGFPATVLRLPMVNGERDYFHRVEAYGVRALDGGPLLVPRGPHRLLRHVFAPDVVEIVCRMLEERLGVGETYNLSQDETLSLEGFLGVVASSLGVDLRVVYAPRDVLRDQGLLPACSPFAERWMSVIDNARAKAELGCRFTSPFEYFPPLLAACRSIPPESVSGYEHRARELALAQAYRVSAGGGPNAELRATT